MTELLTLLPVAAVVASTAFLIGFRVGARVEVPRFIVADIHVLGTPAPEWFMMMGIGGGGTPVVVVAGSFFPDRFFPARYYPNRYFP